MIQYHGFYPGIIINTADPEKRGRVQVFVPNISTTLYEDWNKDAVDIKITSASFKPAVLERLKSLLPWAEIAVSFWGGSTSAPQNETVGKPAPSPSDSTANPENKNQSAAEKKSPVDSPKNNGANNPDGKFDGSTAVNTNPNGKKAILAIGTNDYDAKFSPDVTKQNTIKLINDLKAKGYQVYVIPPNPNKYGATTDAVVSAASGIADVISIPDSNQYTGDGVHLNVKTVNNIASQYKDAIFVGDSNAQLFSEEGGIPNSNNFGISGQRSDEVLNRVNQVPISGAGPDTTQASKDQKVIRPTELVNHNGPADIGSRPGAPIGAISTPMVNSKVIVFFHNGNPNFPVCLCNINDCITNVK